MVRNQAIQSENADKDVQEEAGTQAFLNVQETLQMCVSPVFTGGGH